MQAKITLIIGGGIAAYKCLDLVRRGRERGMSFVCVLTAGGAEFVTPLSLAALSERKVFQDLFSLTDEAEMGHIRLSREADLLVVAPATADLMAKMAHGHADDLASTVLLATDKPVLIAPAMNPMMWRHAATQRNVQRLRDDGIAFVGPEAGDMACGEIGSGRMAEPAHILDAIEARLRGAGARGTGPLAGRRALVTSGPTHEPLDPVRYLANRSSGRQGHALARALQEAGAEVTLISGPVSLPDPAGVHVVRVQSAREMAAAVERALPVDIAIFAAAVADWRPAHEAGQKLKKSSEAPPAIEMTENPDILATVAGRHELRPPVVVGFAAETEKILAHGRAKLARKGCDLICINDVGSGKDVFGGARNAVTILDREGTSRVLPEMDKLDLAREIVAIAAGRLS
ncbi:MAG: bifunctional phosphopantothenoylcysteine decarboxylase/phosphopantothenate--cysteine ligase CoaBC [Geminicoccaceae bacterium]|nr:bifunctional phosphopantothenoylcysteine decarboxylase/phosphopantothenate--cysteine ligase CoaBC [Geminicoccaceae bacterium]